MMNRKVVKHQGVSLIELIIAIVVIGIAVGGVITLFTRAVSQSADPMLIEQAVAVAEAYMEEISLKPFVDPNGTEVGETRTTYDDGDDFHGLADSGARDQTDTAVSGLALYNVQVTVQSEALHTVGAADALRIDVRVTHANASNVNVLLTGYRTRE